MPENWSASDLYALYVSMLQIALPITFIFGTCNIVTNIICNAFFRGKLKFGGRF